MAALLVVVIVASAGVGYFTGNSSQHTTTLVSTTTLPSTLINKGIFIINMSGSFYYADDISSDIVVQNPGLAYLLNASVTFDGVKFETICPQGDEGCPLPSGNTTTQTMTTVFIGIYEFNITFPDGKSENVSGLIGDLTYTYAISNGAGILIEYIQYGHPNYGSYLTFLLVSDPPRSSCGPFGCDMSTSTVQGGNTTS